VSTGIGARCWTRSLASDRTDWRDQLCQMADGQFLGGVANCHVGSSGILLAYRYIVQQRLRELRAQRGGKNPYKWVVLTRADYLYGCDLPSLHNFSKVDGQHFVADAYNVPDEQGYRGITDRFSVLPGDLADKVLDVPRYLLSEPDFWKELGVHGRGSCHGKRTPRGSATWRAFSPPTASARASNITRTGTLPSR
ncbi:unnamed protein product, partial [Prorocentrum cordatum]